MFLSAAEISSEVIAVFVATGILQLLLAALFAFIGKTSAERISRKEQHKLNKKLEEHKSALKEDYETRIEELRSTLDARNLELQSALDQANYASKAHFEKEFELHQATWDRINALSESSREYAKHLHDEHKEQFEEQIHLAQSELARGLPFLDFALAKIASKVVVIAQEGFDEIEEEEDDISQLRERIRKVGLSIANAASEYGREMNRKFFPKNWIKFREAMEPYFSLIGVFNEMSASVQLYSLSFNDSNLDRLEKLIELADGLFPEKVLHLDPTVVKKAETALSAGKECLSEIRDALDAGGLPPEVKAKTVDAAKKFKKAFNELDWYTHTLVLRTIRDNEMTRKLS